MILVLLCYLYSDIPEPTLSPIFLHTINERFEHEGPKDLLFFKHDRKCDIYLANFIFIIHIGNKHE